MVSGSSGYMQIRSRGQTTFTPYLDPKVFKLIITDQKKKNLTNQKIKTSPPPNSMYYHFYLGVLFRPLADQQAHDSTDGYDFDITSGPSAHMMTTTITTATGDRASPRTICTESAHAVIALAQSFRRIHTLRRTPAFLPYFVYAAGLMLLEQDWIEARGGATNDAAAVDGVDGVVDGMDGVDGGAGGAGAGSGRGSSSSGSQIGGMSRDSVQSAGVAMALAQLAEMARTHPAAAEALEDLRSKDMNG